MPSTTPFTDSLMRRADSMAPNAVVVSAGSCRTIESAMRRLVRLKYSLDAFIGSTDALGIEEQRALSKTIADFDAAWAECRALSPNVKGEPNTTAPRS